MRRVRKTVILTKNVPRLHPCAAAIFVVLVCASAAAVSSDDRNLAETPPMGWNSYASYGTNINEAQVKANARWLADHLNRFGWRFVLVDMEWYVTDPTPSGNSRNSHYAMDAFGRYTPALNRFPSAADEAGFKPLAA